MRKEIDQSLGETGKAAQAEKVKYERLEVNVKELNDRVKGYMEKFDQIKEEMTTNSAKFGKYQQDIDTKQIEIKKLSVEIQNLASSKERYSKILD